MARVKEVTFNIDVSLKAGKGAFLKKDSLRLLVKLNESVCTTVLQQEGIKVVNSISVRDKDGKVKEIHNHAKQVAGRIVVVKEYIPEDVEVLVEKIAEMGALAVFVAIDPGLVTDIPVFVVNRHLLNDMGSARGVVVSFKSVHMRNLPSGELEGKASEDKAKGSEGEDKDNSNFDMDYLSIAPSEVAESPSSNVRVSLDLDGDLSLEGSEVAAALSASNHVSSNH